MKTKNTTITMSVAACGLCLAGYGIQAQNLFVGSYGSESVVQFSGSTPSTFATGLNYPTGLAFDNSGDLFESDQGSGHIYEWVKGAGTTPTTFASSLNQPAQMTVNAAGDLFVIVGGGSTVDEFNSAGTVINTITGLSLASGLAFDSVGDLYISNANGSGQGTGFITKITLGGGKSTFASGLNNPNGLAFNAAGDLFVTDMDPFNTITEFTPAGSPTTFATNLNQPFAIAFDTSGDMFVADGGVGTSNGDITEFAANGKESVFNSSVSKPVSLAFDGETLPVPEPSEYALVSLGLSALLFGAYRAKKTA